MFMLMFALGVESHTNVSELAACAEQNTPASPHAVALALFAGET